MAVRINEGEESVSKLKDTIGILRRELNTACREIDKLNGAIEDGRIR